MEESKMSYEDLRYSKNYKPVEINCESFLKYAEKHGRERAQGYFDALKAVVHNMDEIFYNHKKREYYTPHTIMRGMSAFQDDVENVLKEIKKSKVLKSKQEPDSPK